MMQKDRGLVVGSAAGAVVAAVAAVRGILCCLGPVVVAVLGAHWIGRRPPHRCRWRPGYSRGHSYRVLGPDAGPRFLHR